MSTAILPPVFRSERLLEEELEDELSLADEVWEALIHTGYRQLRTIDLQHDGAMITLSGQVPTYFLKQIAQGAAMSVAGVLRINNELCVVSP